MPDCIGPRPSAYRVAVWRDVIGAMAGAPGVLRSMVGAGLYGQGDAHHLTPSAFRSCEDCVRE